MAYRTGSGKTAGLGLPDLALNRIPRIPIWDCGRKRAPNRRSRARPARLLWPEYRHVCVRKPRSRLAICCPAARVRWLNWDARRFDLPHDFLIHCGLPRHVPHPDQLGPRSARAAP